MTIRSKSNRSNQGPFRTMVAILMSMAILLGPSGTLSSKLSAQTIPTVQVSEVAAAFFHRGENVSYFFQGHQYYRLTGTNVDAGYPKDLPGEWKGLPVSFHSGIDAAVQDPSSNNIYFFKGNAYSAFNSANKTAYPGYDNVTLPGGWQGLPASFHSGIDAALDDDGSIILYKGGRQVVITNERFVSESAIPASVLASGPLSAAFKYSNGRNYFFSGSKVARAIGFDVEPRWPNEINDVWIGVNAGATSVATATRSGETPPPPSPLTNNEMAHVMQWISVKTSAARLPFCWRQSIGRGVGKIMECPNGYAKDPGSLICTTPCKADEQYFDDICYPRDCPAGFRNDGLYCGKPEAKTRESFPWQPGDPLLPNYSGPTGRCEAKYGEGNCERGGALIFPKCGTGFTPVAQGSVCTPICPSGYSDIGVSCKKPTSQRGVVYANTCPAGLEKDATGEICYPSCQSVIGNDFTGVGPVCWQNCPSQQNVDCGAGCATTQGECAKSVLTMTSSPIIAAVKIAALVVTFGGSSAATGGAGAAVGGGKLIANSPKLLKLAQLADRLQRFYKTNETLIQIGSANVTMVLAWKSQIELFATEFADNFGDMTSPEIEKEIDSRFSKEAALEIKKEWGRHHVGLMMEANAINTANNVLSVAGIADPTGLVGVVSAFTNPLCKDDTPFPNVNPKY
jgi:hypothetical protein